MMDQRLEAPTREASPPRPREGRRRSGPLLALASLVLSLAAAEAALWLFMPLPDPYASLKRIPETRWPGSPYVPSSYPPHHRRTLRAEPGLSGIDERPRTFSLNNLAYRGDSLAIPKPPGELRVFVVGGSTTECFFLDDSEALTAVLQRRLSASVPGVRVYGAGKSGDRSYDHVAMVAHRIAHLQPDVLVVFAGINDLGVAARGTDYLLRAGEGEGMEMDAWMVARMGATELQFPRLVQAALTGRGIGEADSATSAYRQAAEKRRALPPARRPPPTNVRPYAENLATLAGIGRAQGAAVVLMTQATTWNSRVDPRASQWHWMTGTRERYDEADLDAAMEHYNDATRAVGAAQGVPVFDLARLLPKSLDFFYDDVHFNVRGADTTGTLLARFMLERGIVAAPGARARGGP